MSEARKRNPLVIVLIAVVFGLLLFLAIDSSGLMSKDYETLTITSAGADTVVQLGDEQRVITGATWPSPPLKREVQVRGWTTSMWVATPQLDIGDPSYVDGQYRVGGIVNLRVGNNTLVFQRD